MIQKPAVVEIEELTARLEGVLRDITSPRDAGRYLGIPHVRWVAEWLVRAGWRPIWPT